MPAPASPASSPVAQPRAQFYPLFISAWLLCAVFYFLQYALRSAPGVMVPELTSAWNLSALGLSSLLGLYYYTYAGFSIVAGAITLVLAVITFVATPREADRTRAGRGTFGQMFAPYKVVLSNPQSYLCGLCAGLLFLPTTIGDMIWGVSMLQNGFGAGHAEAVNRAAMVPLGWVVGAPLLGYVADRMGRRKPVLVASALGMLVLASAILYLPAGVMPVYLGGFLFGVASGAAMIPYSIIKEVNPDKAKGSATGAMNFLVFTISALAAPVAGWVLQQRAGGAPPDLLDFQQWGGWGLGGIAVAIVLALFLKETGAAVTSDASGRYAANQAAASAPSTETTP